MLQQVVVRTILHQAAAVEHEHSVGACSGRQSVSNRNRRTTRGQLIIEAFTEIFNYAEAMLHGSSANLYCC